MTTYLSAPTQRMRLGDYQFESGRMDLPEAEAAKFDKFLEGFSPAIRNQIRKVDLGVPQSQPAATTKDSKAAKPLTSMVTGTATTKS